MDAFDKLLEGIGPYGPYQLVMHILLKCFETPAGIAIYQPVFTGALPTWICPAQEQIHNNTGNYGNNLLYTGQQNTHLYQNGTSDHNMIIESTSGNEGNYSTNQCDPGGKICQGAEYTSPPTTISEWNLVCNLEYVNFGITTAYMVGIFFGAAAAGQLTDSFGRKRMLYTYYVFFLAFTCGSSFASSWQIYAVLRFCVGFLYAGVYLISITLPLELVGKKYRTIAGCWGTSPFSPGLMAAIAYWLRDWRQFSLACSLVSVPLLLSWFVVPESPRWLVQKGRTKEARKILSKIASVNKIPTPSFEKIYAEFEVANAANQEKPKHYNYFDVCRTPTLTKQTIIFIFVMFVNSLVYYGTALNSGNLSGNPYLNFALVGLVELPGLLLVVFISDRFGRRRTLFSSSSLSGVSLLAVLFVYLAGRQDSLSWLIVVLSMVGRGCITAGWSLTQTYAAEIFPTVIRNIGLATCSMSARIGCIVAPQIIFLHSVSPVIPFLTFGALGIISGLLACLLPETLHRPLPDTLPARTWCYCVMSADTEDDPDPEVSIPLSVKS